MRRGAERHGCSSHGAGATAGLSDRRFGALLAALLLFGLLVRLLYTWAQTGVDPWYADPILDGRYYVNWATALAQGSGAPRGAFYLAPLYPYALALWVRAFGEVFWVLYAAQHLLALSSAALLALGGRRFLGDVAALSAAALFLLYPPLLFFAARPLSETLAIFLLVSALLAVQRGTARFVLAAGVLVGLASTARPNLLLVAVCWIAGEAWLGRWRRVLLLAAGVVVAVLPVTARNALVSGHLVPISSNGGITAFHGNGPGARGIYTHPAGFSHDVARQRAEATAHARARSGSKLDDVEADAWWGRQAWAARWSRPAETAGLLAWRAALVLDNHEHGLDYPPTLDPNPFRMTLRWPGGGEVAWVPWALLLGLAGVGVSWGGFRESGGWRSWSAIFACAAMPVLFYVSSRYRLPAAALMTIPAGSGVAVLLGHAARERTRLYRALAVGVVLVVVSLALPSGELRRLELADGLSGRALSYLRAHRLDEALTDARDSVALDDGSAVAWLNLAVVLATRDEPTEAEAAFRRALELEPGLTEAAWGLAGLLSSGGRYGEAVSLMRRTLVIAPRCERCWIHLVVALYASGDAVAAREAAARAGRVGVGLPPELLQRLAREPGGTD